METGKWDECVIEEYTFFPESLQRPNTLMSFSPSEVLLCLTSSYQSHVRIGIWNVETRMLKTLVPYDQVISMASCVAYISDREFYVTDESLGAIFSVIDGKVSEFVGGTNTSSKIKPWQITSLNHPKWIRKHYREDELWICDSFSRCVRSIPRDPTSHKTMKTFGKGVRGLDEGSPEQCSFRFPIWLGWNPIDGNLYVCDSASIRVIDDKTHMVSNYAGDETGYCDGPRKKVLFSADLWGAFSPHGYLFLSDVINGRIRVVDFRTEQVRTVAGGKEKLPDFPTCGLAGDVLISNTRTIDFEQDTGNLIILDTNLQRSRRIRGLIDPSCYLFDGKTPHTIDYKYDEILDKCFRASNGSSCSPSSYPSDPSMEKEISHPYSFTTCSIFLKNHNNYELKLPVDLLLIALPHFADESWIRQICDSNVPIPSIKYFFHLLTCSHCLREERTQNVFGTQDGFNPYASSDEAKTSCLSVTNLTFTELIATFEILLMKIDASDDSINKKDARVILLPIKKSLLGLVSKRSRLLASTEEYMKTFEAIWKHCYHQEDHLVLEQIVESYFELSHSRPEMCVEILNTLELTYPQLADSFKTQLITINELNSRTSDVFNEATSASKVADLYDEIGISRLFDVDDNKNPNKQNNENSSSSDTSISSQDSSITGNSAPSDSVLNGFYDHPWKHYLMERFAALFHRTILDISHWKLNSSSYFTKFLSINPAKVESIIKEDDYGIFSGTFLHIQLNSISISSSISSNDVDQRSNSISTPSIHSPLVPNFSLLVGNDIIKVHDWIIAMKWDYFNGALNAGLAESIERNIVLPSTVFPSVESVYPFLYYLYTSDPSMYSTVESCTSLILGAPEILICDMDGNAYPQFDLLFTHFYTVLSSALSIDNLENVTEVAMMLNNSWLFNRIRFFIVDHAKELLESHSLLYDKLSSGPLWTQLNLSGIFDRMRKGERKFAGAAKDPLVFVPGDVANESSESNAWIPPNYESNSPRIKLKRSE